MTAFLHATVQCPSVCLSRLSKAGPEISIDCCTVGAQQQQRRSSNSGHLASSDAFPAAVVTADLLMKTFQ